MVPVAMAYAGLAGLPPQAGLVTAFAAMAAYAVFGTTRHLKVTASSSVAVMSAAVVGALAVAGDPRYLELSAMLALLVGLFLLAAGVAKLGFMSQFLAKSVVTASSSAWRSRSSSGRCPRCSGSRRRRAGCSSGWSTWPATGRP